jgi:glycosyltransferase involved in cell wall biosynthesis
VTPQLPDVAIFADDWGFREYLEPYASAATRASQLRFGREPQLNADAVSRCLANSKVVWFDQLHPLLMEISHGKRTDNALAICRLRGTEFLDLEIDNCRWEFFDRIVVSNPITADVLRDRFDRIDSHCHIHVLPPAISLPEADLRDKHKTRYLAYVGRISTAQNGQLLLQCLAAARQLHPDWKLFIIGEFETLSLRIYFEQMLKAMNLADNIEFNPPGTDMADWYADKSFFVAPFCSSGQEAYVYQAMAFGLRPVVHGCFGAAQMFDEKNLFGTIKEFCSLIDDNGYHPQDYRRYVAEKHDVRLLLPAFVDLLSDAVSGKTLPKVSVLVPTFNRSNFLSRLLTNLGNQTYANREIVVVDDCSTDDTETVVRQLLPSRPDIVYYRNDVNQGNVASFGIAAKKATGEYLLLCCDDDDLDNDALRLFVACSQKKSADHVVYCDLAVVDGDNNLTDVWEYRDYYSNHDLLKSLIDAGANLIPEVFFVRKELFHKIYIETFTKRFINTYYLPMLRRLKMSHLAQPLYRYTVHRGGTYGTAVGLFDRGKSNQNFINAALFMYSPIEIFGESEGSPTDQVATAYGKVALTLVEHGKRFFAGEMYTGYRYKREDRLFALYFYNAYHWLEMARRYGLETRLYIQLLDAIVAVMNPREFDPVRDANMPSYCRRLPWFANKPSNNLSQFVALDIVTIGKAPFLSKEQYTLHQEGKVHIWVCNYPLANAEQLDQVMSTNVITAINLFDPKAIEPTLRYLAERHLFSVYVLNFTSVAIPPMKMLRNIINVKNCTCEQFEDYLALLTKLTTTEQYAHPHLQTTH